MCIRIPGHPHWEDFQWTYVVPKTLKNKIKREFREFFKKSKKPVTDIHFSSFLMFSARSLCVRPRGLVTAPHAKYSVRKIETA